MASAQRPRRLPAPFVLPAGFGALLLIGAVAVGTHGALSARWVLILAAIVVAVVAVAGDLGAATLTAFTGWLTVAGFSRPPYAQLRPAGAAAAEAAITMCACCLAGAGAGALVRRLAASFTLWIVEVSGHSPVADMRAEGLSVPGGVSRPAADMPAEGLTVPDGLGRHRGMLRQRQAKPADPATGDPFGGIRGRRQVAAAVVAVAVLPLLTAGLVAGGQRLSLDDDLLIYLVAVVAVAVAGGFWPAVLAAVAASLLLNWYFTPPVHTFTIEKPQNLLALLLFVTVAVTVSSIVHLAARRALQAARSGGEAASLLALAQTVLGGADTPTGVLDHLTRTLGGRAELLERSGGKWLSVAVSGSAPVGAEPLRVEANTRSLVEHPGSPGASAGLRDDAEQVIRATTGPGGMSRPQSKGVSGRHVEGENAASADAESCSRSAPSARREQDRGSQSGSTVALVVAGQARPVTPRLLDGFAAQAAAALDRERLRIQAAQAEVLAEGNRMRTALLAAVSHDLRTPLSSIKASVGTLRQPDLECSEADETSLLAAIEASADRLDALIGNLLDMSRLSTGSLQPFLRPISIDEVAPAALRGLDTGPRVQLMVPEDLPLVRTDPGLLERVLANLFANAMFYSPLSRPPTMRARTDGEMVVLEVADHGTGVPDALKERMFEPFERLDNRGKSSGVGLGLAVAKGFIEAMGAAIVAADTPGGGLTMRVTLPVAGRPAPRDLVTEA